MLEHWQWPEHFLFVSIFVKERAYGLLVDHATQEDVLDHIIQRITKKFDSIQVTILSEESFEILKPTYVGGYFVEGN